MLHSNEMQAKWRAKLITHQIIFFLIGWVNGNAHSQSRMWEYSCCSRPAVSSCSTSSPLFSPCLLFPAVQTGLYKVLEAVSVPSLLSGHVWPALEQSPVACHESEQHLAWTLVIDSPPYLSYQDSSYFFTNCIFSRNKCSRFERCDW